MSEEKKPTPILQALKKSKPKKTRSKQIQERAVKVKKARKSRVQPLAGKKVVTNPTPTKDPVALDISKPDLVEPKDAKEGDVLYVISDQHIPEFKVLYSANAWWLDRSKTWSLINAFKLSATVEEACIYAGISKGQYTYFTSKHKEFLTIKELLVKLPSLQAKQTVIAAIPNSPDEAKWWLEMTERKSFHRQQKNENENFNHDTVELAPETKETLDTVLKNVMSGVKPKLNIKQLQLEEEKDNE